jgi:hypothetical protein
MSNSLPEPDRNGLRAHVGELANCPNCGRVFPYGIGLCEFCHSALEAHTSLNPRDPYVSEALAESFAYREASQHPDKPIALIGMWFLLGPIFVLLVVADLCFLFSWPQMLREMSDRGYHNLPIIIGLDVAMYFGTLVFGTLLYRTTRNYYRLKKNAD